MQCNISCSCSYVYILGNDTFNYHTSVTFIFFVHFLKIIDAVHLLDQQINKKYLFYHLSPFKAL